MNSINHALWGATIGRAVGLPIEGAVIASIPDIISVPVFAFSKFYYNSDLTKSPKWVFVTDWITHNWFVGIIFTAILFLISPQWGTLGLGYLWHVVEDAFLHTKLAAPFLWPVWKGKIQIFSAASHPWIQILDFLLIIGVNYLLFPQSPLVSPSQMAVIGAAVALGIAIGKTGEL